MVRLFRKHTSTIVVAMITAAVTAGVPAIAANIINADKLDGREGVGCDATKAKRAGAYVATCASGARAGLLPNNIIQKAPNSGKLDGRTAADFDDAQTLDGKDSTEFLSAGGKSADADQLDGRDSADFDDAQTLAGKGPDQFAAAGHLHAGSDITSGTVAEARIAPEIARDSEILPTVLGGDGPGSGLDADTVDGLDSTDFMTAQGQVQFTASALDWVPEAFNGADTQVEDAGAISRAVKPTTGTGVIVIEPPFTPEMFGHPVEISSVRFCYNASNGGVFIDAVEFQAINAGIGAGNNVGATVIDATDRTDNQCRSYTLTSPRDARDTIFRLLVTGNWTTANSPLSVGRVTLVGNVT